MPKHLVPIVATVFVMLFLWLSAVPLLSWYEFSAYHQELADESFKWHHSGISDYSFEFELLDFATGAMPQPIRIHVQDSKFLAAYRIDNNALLDISGVANIPQTIESAFEIAERLLGERPYKIDIEYDADLHYPTSISVSYSDSKSDSAMYSIRSFAAVYDSS